MPVINGFTSKAEAIRYLRSRGFNIHTLLASPEANPKVAKNGKIVDVDTYPLHLAPFTLSGFNTCAMASSGCAQACLHTAGNPAYMEQKERSRITKTQAYFKEREAFIAVLVFEMLSKYNKAKRDNKEIAFRPNATSDLPWEKRSVNVDGQDMLIMDMFYDVQFYDYTAFPKRAIAYATGAMPKNYHITFSRKEDNHEACDEVLNNLGNVAAVASKEIYKQAIKDGFIIINGMMRKITDGDAHDYRPADPTGVIVLLKAKGDAINDTSGFTIR